MMILAEWNLLEEKRVATPRSDATESVGKLPTFMESVLDTVEKVLEKNADCDN